MKFALGNIILSGVWYIDYCKGIKYTGKNIVTPPNYDEVIDYVRTSGGEIIKNKQVLRINAETNTT